MFWRILAGFNLVANPYIGYLVYGYMWDDSAVMTLVVFFLLLQQWVDSLYHVVVGEDIRTKP